MELNNISVDLEKYCWQIRKSMERVKHNSVLLQEFPTGCCRDSAIILGLYLKEKGYQEVNYCHKQYDDISVSHGWLEVGGWILDLTADQFQNGYPPVYILPNSSVVPIYRNKESEPCKVAIVSNDVPALLDDYMLVVGNIEIC